MCGGGIGGGIEEVEKEGKGEGVRCEKKYEKEGLRQKIFYCVFQNLFFLIFLDCS